MGWISWGAGGRLDGPEMLLRRTRSSYMNRGIHKLQPNWLVPGQQTEVVSSSGSEEKKEG